MKKLFRILSLILLIIFILPYGYSSEIIKLKNIKSDKPIYKPTINEILKLINEEKDMEYWYGIYSNNEKFGWMNLRSNVYRSDKFKEDVLEVVGEMDFISKVLGNDGKSVTSHFKVLFTEIYQSKAPFRIIESHQAIQMDDLDTSYFGEKQGHNFKIVYKDNEKNVRELLLTNFNYSLYDLLAIDAWFRKKPRKINDMVVSITFDFESLEYILNETSIKEIINKKVSGVDYVYYKANSLDKADIADENFSFQFLFDSSGKPIQFFIGGLELRLESEKKCKKIR